MKKTLKRYLIKSLIFLMVFPLSAKVSSYTYKTKNTSIKTSNFFEYKKSGNIASIENPFSTQVNLSDLVIFKISNDTLSPRCRINLLNYPELVPSFAEPTETKYKIKKELSALPICDNKIIAKFSSKIADFKFSSDVAIAVTTLGILAAATSCMASGGYAIRTGNNYNSRKKGERYDDHTKLMTTLAGLSLSSSIGMTGVSLASLKSVILPVIGIPAVICGFLGGIVSFY